MLGFLENRVPPPLVMLVTAAGMGLIAMRTSFVLVDPLLRYAAVALFLVGGGVFGLSGFRAFGKAKTTIDPVRIDAASTLVTGGIYQVTRNPMYVGLTALLIAWAAYLAAPWAYLGPVFFVLYITRFQIIPEERMLIGKFGAPYETYRKRTRRWI